MLQRTVAVAAGLVACSGVAACSQGPPGTRTSTPGSLLDDLCPEATTPATGSPALHAAIVKVEKAAGVTDETGSGALPGYVSVIQCTDTNELFVFWKGNPPKSVTTAIAAVHVKVTIRKSAPHSTAELQDVQDKVWADKSSWETEGVHVQSTSTRADGRWLEVGVDNDADALAAIQDKMSERYPDVAVKVVYAVPLVPL